ncbi:hypothetical protein BC936DRAFT_141301 [Jimgerdemannia flammicorona]|uniref:Uncharacterized protein n=1 Tax=Jimgerdemannia flammicorona TaxID=994334 RepID=A0A433A2H0_9FUNG|nr:hypothetical protein BC936DRAFT_141301 [Jimgerdemannia flammicorona]
MCDGETEGVALVPAETTLMGIYQRCLAASWMRTQMMESEYWVMVSVRFDVGTIRGAPISVEHQRQHHRILYPLRVVGSQQQPLPSQPFLLIPEYTQSVRVVGLEVSQYGVTVVVAAAAAVYVQVLWSVLVDKTTVLVGVIEVEVMADDDAEETAEIEVEGEVDFEVEGKVDFEVEGEVDFEVEGKVDFEVEGEVDFEVEGEVEVEVECEVEVEVEGEVEGEVEVEVALEVEVEVVVEVEVAVAVRETVANVTFANVGRSGHDILDKEFRDSTRANGGRERPSLVARPRNRCNIRCGDTVSGDVPRVRGIGPGDRDNFCIGNILDLWPAIT